MKINFLIIFFLSVALSAAAQQGEDEFLLSELLIKEKSFVSRQDSLQLLIDKNRYLLSTDTKSANKYTKEILSLEGLLFDVRNQLGIITSEKNVIQQRLVIKNINTSSSGKEEDKSRNILQSKFFKENLSIAQLKMLGSYPQIVRTVAQYNENIVQQSEALMAVVVKYKASQSKAEADSLKRLADQFASKIAAYDSEIKTISDNLYSVKFDIYNVLLDKINTPMNILQSLGEKSRNVRSEEYDVSNSFIAPSLSMFNRNKALAIEYEKMLAQQLGLSASLDSLNIALKGADVTKYDILAVEIPVWNFVDFAPLVIGGAESHNASNPVRELDVASNGDMYKVEIGTYAKAQTNYSVFRKINPVEYEELPDGKVAYYAGTYNNEQEAIADADRLKKLGVKAKVAHWKNGQAVRAESAAGEKNANVLYRIEIPALTQGVKDIIAEKAPEKELAKVVNQSGKSVFSLGNFDSKEHADQIALLIDGAKVISIY